MDNGNLCIPGGSGRLSVCAGCDDDTRQGCPFFSPAGPWSNGCLHHRPEYGGHCDNTLAHDDARNRSASCK